MTRNGLSQRLRTVAAGSLRPVPRRGDQPAGRALTAATEHPWDLGDRTPRCAGADPELFWPASAADVAEARSVCADCPLAVSCLAVAQDRGEWGVWGGELLARGKPTTELPGNVRPSPHDHARSA